MQCEEQYASNTGSSRIPSVFQSHLYFRKAKYYLNLLSDPFISCTTVTYFLYRFLRVLFNYTTTSINKNRFVPNPWNFRLYNARDTPSCLIHVQFKYNSTEKKHEIEEKHINDVITDIIQDMHYYEPYMTLFPVGYACDAGWTNNGTVGGAHAVVCGILKKEKKVFVFLLDPNGVQVEGPKWWQKYTQIFFRNTREKIPIVEMIEHFFNEQMVRVLIEKIDENYPNHYEYSFDTKLNLNPYNINVGGSKYQEDGYCVLVSFFFIHFVYNNITIHNRKAFADVTDPKEIVQYLKELMIFIHKLINTPPFTNTQFF